MLNSLSSGRVSVGREHQITADVDQVTKMAGVASQSSSRKLSQEPSL